MALFVILANLIHLVYFLENKEKGILKTAITFNYFWLKASFSAIMKQCFKYIFDVYIFCPFQKFSRKLMSEHFPICFFLLSSKCICSKWHKTYEWPNTKLIWVRFSNMGCISTCDSYFWAQKFRHFNLDKAAVPFLTAIELRFRGPTSDNTWGDFAISCSVGR